jgi:predicted TIM-barrel fold metal-dependent hydrolase
VIDYWCNAFTPDRAPLWQAVIEQGGLDIRTRAEDPVDGFAAPAEMIQRMDALDIEALVLPVHEVAAGAPLDDFGYYAVHDAEMRPLHDTYPDRFYGAFSVTPGDLGSNTDRGADLGAAAAALAEGWCVALHSHTHSWGIAFDDPRYLPYYELCADHDVPFVMQAGASGGHFAHDSGHPAAIAGPATDFPSVDFVLSHTGAPWVAETIAMAERFPNVVVGTATHPPRRWTEPLIEFLNGPGDTNVLYGSGYPLTGHARALAQLDGLDLTPSRRQNLLTDNAARIFTRIRQNPGG